jgi:acetoin utilization deacetylase AcuC-like enzyme
MQTFYLPDQTLHHPNTYLSRGQMRAPQEVPSRLTGILQGLQNLGLAVQAPPDCGIQPIAAVHETDYLAFLQTAHSRWKEMPEDWGDEVISNIFVRTPNPMRGILAQAARYLADGSCPIGEHTWRSAYAGAQCATAAANAVLDGEQYAYALTRPPGHHARPDAAGGFCYINHAAVAAQRLRSRFERVAIVDTDMHHGQGSQEIFYHRPDVMYVSVHGDPTNFYPVVAGFDDETGEGDGHGFNLNLPMPHGSTESVFFSTLDRALDAVTRFAPQAIVLSHGYDIYEFDPQSKVAVTTAGFKRLGQIMATLNLPTVVVQEGGYHLDSLAINTESFFNGLLG